MTLYEFINFDEPVKGHIILDAALEGHILRSVGIRPNTHVSAPGVPHGPTAPIESEFPWENK
jgi:hypothetical protein